MMKIQTIILSVGLLATWTSHATTPTLTVEPIPTTEVYICSTPESNGFAVDMQHQKMFFINGVAKDGLALAMSDITPNPACADSFTFSVDIMGTMVDGAMTGACAQPEISLELQTRGESQKMMVPCTYQK